MKTASLDRQKNIVQWVSQATGINTLGVKIRLRGNDLHILCEGGECPKRWQILSDLLRALQQTDLDALTANDSEQPSIYQVLVYGRKKGENRPQWCHRVYLNQLDRHLQQVEQALLRDAGKAGGLIVSNESLARQGDPEAIARYLSETLSSFGISVKVKVKKQKLKDNPQVTENRLWILCQSSYSPPESLIAEPIAKKLRYLKLTGYQDAVIVTQVTGESKPDWLLRVDLKPPDLMLKEWARWGDLQSISRLLLEEFISDGIKVTTSLQESTLHVFCTAAKVPEQKICVEKAGSLLNAIAPQAIYNTAVYGQVQNQNQPAWVDWVSLPAQEHPNLAVSPLELASSGDEAALTFLLERVLNPDLDLRLKTGGIRVLLLRKADLLHVMCDAPVCPSRKKVAVKVAQLVKELRIPGLLGVRIYGRRAGNKEPVWNQGMDFATRRRFVPEATPEFAVSAGYVRELLPADVDEPILRPDFKASEFPSFVAEVAQDWTASARKWLVATPIFSEIVDSDERSLPFQGYSVAAIWGFLGLLLTVQVDWGLNQVISQDSPPLPKVAETSPDQSSDRTAAFTGDNNGNSTFNASSFTSDTKEKATATAILLAARSQTPTFNARQLDEQLALYKEKLAKAGKPPDVLIIGSSRGLRGVDPVALGKGLAAQGYGNLDIFNLGINGATAQVVNFMLQHALEPSEIPKLIIWADGARAFNSGREDITFRSIAASPGYKKAIEKSFARGENTDLVKNPQVVDSQQENSYQAVNKWLSDGLASVSATYPKRSELKTFLGEQLKIFPGSSIKESKNSNAEQVVEESVDFDGFLALSTRFDPVTYYQKHPKVSGDYDNDYKSFQLAGIQDAAILAVLQFARSHKISIVFANMPLTAEYLDSIRSKHEQEFQQYMVNLASEYENFTFRDLSRLYPQNNGFFSDPSHLNRFGAYEVSKKLANDPMIPWMSNK
ncbi:hypothetical protein [Calothrix sp. PCC 6303]|uniref:hypothetical protein n=1 Tax=Calothrix sp. PCC 6303 TaxID=1170562 RepID=UPI0002A05028|nr:hypothetical protein [Calothrix sp. PCC 6303]AFZ00311.1 hypothetical protein Cal6303_1250 [Calothrix sp. PCC 6303]